MINDDRCFLSIAEAARRIASHDLSPVELTEALPGADRDAMIRSSTPISADARSWRARRRKQAEAAIMAGNYREGPLHGIPFGAEGHLLHRRHPYHRPFARLAPISCRTDATTVRKLEDAGGVLLGKLATHEFAHGGPSFDLPWPPARNPWNREHFTGGSSSGSGAGGRGRAADGRAGLGHRRVDPQPGGAVRAGRAEADLRPGQPRRRL